MALSALAAVAAVTAVHAAGTVPDTGHAVFVMTNDAASNEVIAYDRTPYGTLQSPQH
jgi:hypothetical protein